MAFATLLPQIRTRALCIEQAGKIRDAVGFSTTRIVLANGARTIHSRLELLKQSVFAQNALEPNIEAMDP